MDDRRPAGTRQLWILRHAKAAAEPAAGGRDRDRPLTDQGRRDAAALGARLAAEGPVLDTPGLVLPGVALVSAAARTVETAALVCGGLGGRIRTHTYQSLYSAEPETVLAYVREVDDDPAAVLVVGHNPTMSHLAYDLASEGSPGRARLDSHGLATCSLAVVDLAIGSWEDAAADGGALVGLFGPPY
jgi:phosphohistidine phosphatase